MINHTITRIPYEPGRLIMTRAAANFYDPYEVWCCITRHLRCDWGDICESDWRANDAAVRDGDRLVSAYRLRDDTVKLLIITEADRSVTTILRPEDY